MQERQIKRKVFISHAWEEDDEKRQEQEAWISRLRDCLLESGVEDVFLDRSAMRGNVQKTMEENVTRSDRFLVVCTPRYVSVSLCGVVLLTARE